MQINQMRFLTAHNAFASEAYGYPKVSMNQTLSIHGQLAYGARAFMLDVYDWGDPPDIICSHGRPVEGQKYTPLEDILKEITTFQDAISSVVIVVLLLEDYVDENRTAPWRWRLLETKLANTNRYVPLNASSIAANGWPNIEASSIVAFAQNYRPYGLNTSTIPNMYDLCVETVYGTDSINHNSWNTPRAESNPLDGPAKAANISIDNTLAIVNHFPTNPDWSSRDYAGNINALRELSPHLETFVWNNSRIPNFFALNFVNVGAGITLLGGWSKFTDNFRYPHWMDWVNPGDLNFAQENLVVVPDGQFVTGVEGLNEPGSGLINLRLLTGSPTIIPTPATPEVNFSDSNLGSGWLTPVFNGQTASDVLKLAVPSNYWFGAMIGCIMNGCGLVNIVVKGATRSDGTLETLANNEALYADKVGPDNSRSKFFANNNDIRAFHIRYDSSKGVRDMRYGYR